MRSMIWLWLRGSSVAVGSSSNNTAGSSTRTEASATRFFSPPRGDRADGREVPLAACIPVSAQLAKATCSLDHPNCRGAKATSSNTVGLNSCTSGFWKTSATRTVKGSAKSSRCTSSAVNSCSSKWSEPCDGEHSPSSMRSSVDFPEPFAPSRASRSPRLIWSDNPRQRGNAVIVEANVAQLEQGESFTIFPSRLQSCRPARNRPSRRSPTLSDASRKEPVHRRGILATASRDRHRCSGRNSY